MQRNQAADCPQVALQTQNAVESLQGQGAWPWHTREEAEFLHLLQRDPEFIVMLRPVWGHVREMGPLRPLSSDRWQKEGNFWLIAS